MGHVVNVSDTPRTDSEADITGQADAAGEASPAGGLLQARSPPRIVVFHTSHSKGITVYLTESSAPRPALLLSVKRDLHTVLYLYFQ